MPNISFSKYLLICVLGFVLGGLLWGLVLYLSLPDLQYPFHWAAILILGLFGGVSLAWPLGLGKTVKAVIGGWLGLGAGFVGGAVMGYYTYLSNLVFAIFPIENIRRFLDVDTIEVGFFWSVFLFIGLILGFFLSLFLKSKIWSLMWRGGAGFALGSIVGPVFANLVSDSVLIIYLLAFSLTSAVLGLFLGWGMRRQF